MIPLAVRDIPAHNSWSLSREKADAGEPFALSFDVDLRITEGILALAESWAARQGASKDDAISLRLVLEELLLNLCFHAVGEDGLGTSGKTIPVHVDLTVTAVCGSEPEEPEKSRLRHFVLTLRDTGQEFNPLLYERAPVQSIQNASPGGQGLALVRLLAQQLQYTRLRDANLLSLHIVCNRSETMPRPEFAQEDMLLGTDDATGAQRPIHTLVFLWRSHLAIRQAVLFFALSAIMIWGGLLFYYTTAYSIRRENSREMCAQALHTQNVSSTSFLQRLTRTFSSFTDGLAALPHFERLLQDDTAFYEEMRNGVLGRAITADAAVLGILKGVRGKVGSQLFHRSGDLLSRLPLVTDFEPFVCNSLRALEKIYLETGEPLNTPPVSRWVGPIVDLPGDAGGGHAVMLLARAFVDGNGAEHWIALVVAMPWIKKTLDTLSGFANAVSIFLTQDGRYVVYPPGRSTRGGPHALAEEEDAASPGMQMLMNALAGDDRDVIPLEKVFPQMSPWPLPWQGGTTLAYAPMSIPGWGFILLVASEEIDATAPPVFWSMLLLALCGPVCIAFLAYSIVSRITRPLQSLSRALRGFAEGDFDTPLPMPQARDEASNMLLAFERVRVTLKHSFANLMEATAAEQRVRNELVLARSIQESMLPKDAPLVPGVNIAAGIDMAEDVCGDLFDFFTLPGKTDTLYCLVGDVCGKGIPASVFMSRTMGLARSALLAGKSLPETLAWINEALLRYNDSLMFVTLLVARIDATTGMVSWASAGHPPPLLEQEAPGLRPGTTGLLPWSRDLVLGIKPGVRYSEYSFSLAAGQSMLLYSDGADESLIPPGREPGKDIPGTDRLQEIFFRSCAKNMNEELPRPGAILETMRQALLSPLKGQPPQDDITLMVVRWDGERSTGGSEKHG